MAEPTQERIDATCSSEMDYGALPEHIGYRLKGAYAYSIQTWDALFSALGLPYGQYSVLLMISLNAGLSQLQLAEALGLDSSTIVPITNRFVSLGWIRRSRRRDDRRTYSLRVTPAGQSVLDRAQDILESHEQDLVAPLTPAERATLLRLLIKLTEGRAGIHGRNPTTSPEDAPIPAPKRPARKKQA